MLKKNSKKQLGNRGEEEACKYLIENGYEIIQRNFRCNQGEIDIIAKNKNEIIFVEVKTRRNEHFGKPIDAVDSNKRKHIWDVARFFLYINNLFKYFVRFDVIEVYVRFRKSKNKSYKKLRVLRFFVKIC